MYISQLAPHTTYSGCDPAWAVGPHERRISQDLIRKLHFKFINISTLRKSKLLQRGRYNNSPVAKKHNSMKFVVLFQ